MDIRTLAGMVYDRLEEVHGPNPGGPPLRDEWIDWAAAKLDEQDLWTRMANLA